MKSTLLTAVIFISTLLIDLSAYSQWSSNPSINTPLCNLANQQQTPTIISDGSDGSFIAWTDRRSGTDKAYVQHFNAAGLPQWTTNGVLICNFNSSNFIEGMVVDGNGGVNVVFGDGRNQVDGQPDIYIQRFNSLG